MHETDSPAPAIIRDRHLFLRALQHWVPEFWRGFHHGAVDSPEGGRLSAEDCGAYAEEWASHVGIRDRWLVQVLKDTLARWIEQPDDGGAQLQPSYEWFVYSEAIP